jgi:hypothetical protein
MVRQYTSSKSLLVLFTLSLVAAPTEYFAHEGAHYLAARFFGANAIVHFDRVTLEGGAPLDNLQRVVFTASGPTIDWIVGAGALLFLIQRYTPTRLVLAIWVARPLQFVPALLGIEFSSIGIGGELGRTDEAIVAGAIGMSPQAIVWIELAATIPLLALIVFCIPAPSRLPVISILTIGVLSGWAGWLTWGPHVLS